MGNKIRAKLGWELGLGSPGAGRPKRMHQRTYLRLIEKERKQAERAFIDWADWVSKVRP